MRLGKLSIFIILSIIGSNLFGQDFETVSSIEISSTPAKSYLINSQGRLLPGFSQKASTNGEFYMRFNSQGQTFPPVSTNVVRSETILTPTTNPDDIINYTVDQKSTNYDYSDGFGRPIQEINLQASPSKNDVISFNVYDALGNQPKTYLGYIKNTTSGFNSSNPIGEQASFYSNPPVGVASDQEPYGLNIYDNTPDNNITEVFGLGADWHLANANKSAKKLNQFNVLNEVLKLSYDGSSGFPYSEGVYSPNTLTITQTIDEGSQIRRVYQNFLGQTVMSRVGDGTNWNDTYYIYDPAGSLSFVFSPEAVSRIPEYLGHSTIVMRSFLDRWTFQYQYDEEQRVIAKRTPGSIEGDAGWTYILYDQWNRVVLTQDPVERTRNEYSFTKYDRFNRVILKGVYTTTTSLATLRTNVLASSVRYETEAMDLTGYTIASSYPTGIVESNLLSVIYYDNYNFRSNPGWDAEGNSFTFFNQPGYPQATDALSSVNGYITGSKTRVLGSGQTQWLNSVTYYDRKYHIIQSIEESFSGGIVRNTKLYDFTKLQKDQIFNSRSSLSIENTYTYDHAGRVKTVSNSVNGAVPVIMVSNTFNELGQLMEKNVHSTDNGLTFLQSIDNKYNIRGWRTQINNSALTPETGDTNTDLFGMEFQYNPSSVLSVDNGSFTSKKFYNGNLSAIKWKADTKQGTPTEQIYAYDYDVFSRLTQAYYATNSGGTWNGNGAMFNEQIRSYDKNGNIKSILRNGNVQNTKTTIDDLTLGYSLNSNESNRLIIVDDASNNTLGFKPASSNLSEEYQYDNNGNLKFDFNKGISQIDYNVLNLPTSVQFTRADGTVDKIEYTYDADGNKLRKVVKINNNQVWQTDYLGAFQYDNGQLSFIQTSDGRIVSRSGNFEYEYFHTDHEGNVRVVFGASKDVVSYRATMEAPAGSTLAADEESTFSNVATTRSNPPDATYNCTPSSEKVLTPNRAAQCNGYTNKPIGPAISLRVLNADVVYMEAYAKYWNVATNNTNTITNLVSVVSGSYTIPNPTDAATFNQQLGNNLPAASAAVTMTANVPKAYLMWLFFDDSYTYQRSGAVSITTSAYHAFEKLNRTFTADKNGYLFIYVANEDKESAALDVFFDELYIVHQKTTSSLQVTQASDYYPFGLSFNKYCKDKITQNGSSTATIFQNRNLFQGQELQKDLDLGLYQFEARMSDPAIGRFTSIDPLSENSTDQSGYNFTSNNPINRVDPDGRWDWGLSLYSQISTQQNRYWAQHYQNVRIDSEVDGILRGYPKSWKGYEIASGARPMTDLIVDYNPYYEQTAKEFADRISRLEGAGRSYAEQYAAGEYGLVVKALHDFGGLNPIANVAQGLIDAREGNYGSAALNLGSGLMEFASWAKTARTLKASAEIANTTTELAHYYPANAGAAGEWTKVMAERGQILDRYGSVYGTYVSPVRTPFEMRALPPTTSPSDYFRFEVLEPFPMQMSNIAPAFYQPGGGIQYKTPVGINYLESLGYVKILE